MPLRFRFRFGLRTLLVIMTIFAAFFGLVERRAFRQRTLKQAVSSVNGGTKLAPILSWLQPSILTKVFGQDRTMTVVAIKVVGYQAPNLEIDSDTRPYALVSPATMKRLVQHPDMRNVRDLEIIGTSTTPDMVPVLERLQQLERLQLTSSMLVASDMDKLRSALPSCEIDGSSMAHTVHWCRLKIPERRLPDLSVFSRARDGEPEAIDQLVLLSSEDPTIRNIVSRILDVANVGKDSVANSRQLPQVTRLPTKADDDK